MLKRNRKKIERIEAETENEKNTLVTQRFLGMLFDALMSYRTISYYPYTPVF